MKNKKVYGLVGVAALAAIGGTFAYYSAEQTFTNPFNTTNYGSQATEKFNPSDGDEWKPGAEVDKDVYATNTGDGEVWVRVKFDEVWSLANGQTIGHSAVGESGYNELFDITELDTAGVPAADEKRQLDDKDGSVDGDEGTVVHKKYDAVVDAISAANKGWYRGADGYFYYNAALAENEQSGKLLDSVTLAKNTDMGHFIPEYAYMVVEKKPDGTSWDSVAPTYPKPSESTAAWVKVDSELDLPVLPIKPKREDYKDDKDYNEAVENYNKAVESFDTNWPELAKKDVYTYKANILDETAQGYANADYNLNITVEFVQADEKAALAQGWNTEVVKDLVAKAATSTTPAPTESEDTPVEGEGE